MRYEDFRDLLADEPLPAALVDLDALDRNCDRLLAMLGERPVTLRMATKSLRIPALIRRLLDRDPRMQGLMCFSPREAVALADQGFDDLLVAYPVARAPEAAPLAALAARGVRVVATVDSVDQLPVLQRAAAAHDTTLALSIDVDASWRPLGAHIGVRRSPIRSGADALRLARAIADQPNLRLVAAMAYEAQVAGMADTNPHSRLLDPVRRMLKRGSVPAVASLRAEVVHALRDAGFALQIVNGGGTGSLHTTTVDPVVTEVTAGSGFLCPHLFDGYTDLHLEPAAFFALSVVRRSDPGLVTCAGGGYVASGEAGPSRLPIVHLPEGLAPLGMEGFGEVQTPLRVPSGVALNLGDPVICRHAKAGELAEHFGTVALVAQGRVVDRVPTYRGQGHVFP